MVSRLRRFLAELISVNGDLQVHQVDGVTMGVVVGDPEAAEVLAFPDAFAKAVSEIRKADRNRDQGTDRSAQMTTVSGRSPVRHGR